MKGGALFSKQILQDAMKERVKELEDAKVKIRACAIMELHNSGDIEECFKRLENTLLERISCLSKETTFLYVNLTDFFVKPVTEHDPKTQGDLKSWYYPKHFGQDFVDKYYAHIDFNQLVVETSLKEFFRLWKERSDCDVDLLDTCVRISWE